MAGRETWQGAQGNARSVRKVLLQNQAKTRVVAVHCTLNQRPLSHRHWKCECICCDRSRAVEIDYCASQAPKEEDVRKLMKIVEGELACSESDGYNPKRTDQRLLTFLPPMSHPNIPDACFANADSAIAQVFHAIGGTSHRHSPGLRGMTNLVSRTPGVIACSYGKKNDYYSLNREVPDDIGSKP